MEINQSYTTMHGQPIIKIIPLCLLVIKVYNYQSTQLFIVNYAFKATCFDSTESSTG
jgi:hypothetical protein